jgi:hypothetical protein
MAGRSPAPVLKYVLRIGAVVSLSGLAMLLVTTQALAYGPVQGNSTASVIPTSAGAGQQVRFTATFRDQFNQPVSPPVVATFFQMSGPVGCSVSLAQNSATTDVNGQVSTLATLPLSCPGQYVLASAAAGVTVSAAVTETGGFADTTALQQAVPVGLAGTWPNGLMALGLLLVVVGLLGYRFRRRAQADEPVDEPAWPTRREPAETRRER